MDVGAVERLLRSLAFEGLGGLEFRVPAEVSRWSLTRRLQSPLMRNGQVL